MTHVDKEMVIKKEGNIFLKNQRILKRRGILKKRKQTQMRDGQHPKQIKMQIKTIGR